MNRLARRLKKVEAEWPPTPRIFTLEELHLGRLALARAMARSGKSEALKLRARAAEEKLSLDIRSTAARQQADQFRRHIAEYVQPTWHTRWGHPEYIPPIIGSEYDDWDVPDLASRRLAVRCCSLVIELIGEPDPALARATAKPIPWGLIIAQLVEQAALKTAPSE